MTLTSAKKLLVVGGGASDPDAVALVRRMSPRPNPKRQRLIDKTIVDLKAAGIWSQLDCFYMLAAHTEQAAFLNWRQDRFNCTKIGGSGHISDRGFLAAGKARYLKTNMVTPTDSGTLFGSGLNHAAFHGAFPANMPAGSLLGHISAPSGGTGDHVPLVAFTSRNSSGTVSAHLGNNYGGAGANVPVGENMLRSVRAADRRNFGLYLGPNFAASSLQETAPSYLYPTMMLLGTIGGDANGTPTSSANEAEVLMRFAAFGGNGESVKQAAYHAIVQNYLHEVGAVT